MAREYKIEKEMRRQKIISKLNSNTKNFTPLSQRNENEEVSLRDNKSTKISMEMKAKCKEDRHWKAVKCKTIIRRTLKMK